MASPREPLGDSESRCWGLLTLLACITVLLVLITPDLLVAHATHAPSPPGRPLCRLGSFLLLFVLSHYHVLLLLRCRCHNNRRHSSWRCRLCCAAPSPAPLRRPARSHAAPHALRQRARPRPDPAAPRAHWRVAICLVGYWWRLGTCRGRTRRRQCRHHPDLHACPCDGCRGFAGTGCGY